MYLSRMIREDFNWTYRVTGKSIIITANCDWIRAAAVAALVAVAVCPLTKFTSVSRGWEQVRQVASHLEHAFVSHECAFATRLTKWSRGHFQHRCHILHTGAFVSCVLQLSEGFPRYLHRKSTGRRASAELYSVGTFLWSWPQPSAQHPDQPLSCARTGSVQWSQYAELVLQGKPHSTAAGLCCRLCLHW